MQETILPSLGWENLLEKEMGTHSSILVWEIPWTGEPGRLKSLELQGAGCDLAITTAVINVNFVRILQIVQFKEKDP